MALPAVVVRLKGPAPGEPALVWTYPQPVPDVVLLDEEGRRVALGALLRDRASLLGFFYLDCSDACPAAVQRAKQAWFTVAGVQPDSGVVLVTVNPENDRPARSKAWLTSLGLRHAGWHVLGGEPVALGRVLRELRVPAGVRDPRTGVIPHAAAGFLVDGRGRVVARVDLARLKAGTLAMAWNRVARWLHP